MAHASQMEQHSKLRGPWGIARKKNQRHSTYKERTVQANQAAQRFASHSPSIFEYASNFYICQADQLEKLSDILEKLSHRYT